MSTREANQRLVNEAYAHVNEVGKPSYDGNQCFYSGVGCAFSPAVLDDCKSQADNLVNGCTAPHLIADSPHYLKEWAKELDPVFAKEVQNCHDYNTDSKDFLLAFNNSLSNLCNRKNYKFPGDSEAK